MAERYWYARQKLYEALHCPVGEGALRQRLGYAYIDLSILNPDTHLPQDLRDRFNKLKRELKSRADDGRYGPVKIITRSPKAGRLAEEVLSIYVKLEAKVVEP